MHGSTTTCRCSDQSRHPESLPLEKGTKYSVIVEFDHASMQWQPQPYPRLPNHHAARIEWVNLQRFGVLDTSRRYLFYGTSLESQLWKVPDQNAWRSESKLEIDCVCPG